MEKHSKVDMVLLGTGRPMFSVLTAMVLWPLWLWITVLLDLVKFHDPLHALLRSKQIAHNNMVDVEDSGQDDVPPAMHWRMVEINVVISNSGQHDDDDEQGDEQQVIEVVDGEDEEEFKPLFGDK